MTTIRRFTCDDLFTYNNVNLDPLTETYNFQFYLTYLAKWPEYCQMAEGPGKQAMGYVLGKSEGEGELWHGHVTAVTVAPDFRRQHLAQKLMRLLEDVTEKVGASCTLLHACYGCAVLAHACMSWRPSRWNRPQDDTMHHASRSAFSPRFQ